MLSRRLLLGGAASVAASPAVRGQGAPTPGDYLRVLTMRHHVPAASAVVIRNGAVSDVMTVGCDARTLFQAASISKVVAGLVILRLHEKGTIGLDRPVNQALRGWTLPGVGVGGGAGADAAAVTPRLLLCHRGGTTVPGFPGYAVGAPLPDLRQILDGTPPANTPPVVVAWPPGEAFRYSGGGTMVLQRLAEDATGQPFDQLARDLVLAPAGMTRSGFFQPLPPSERNAAAAHDARGQRLAGGFHVYPELAAAGLWSTPGDLARLALAIAASWTGTGADRLLETATARLLATPVADGPTGLGVFVAPRGGRPPYLYHYGVNAGFRAALVFSADAAFGVAIMTDGDGGEALIPEMLDPLFAAAGQDPFKPAL
ncbi:MAG: beta-lactamase family protein [Proteobacteria bacterium]|nr:beta-lactamase family protein [Pseudomonadota bacterium]